MIQSSSGVLYPVRNGRITSPYGWRVLNGSRQFHDGIDFVGDEKAIYAVADGVVIYDYDKYDPVHRWDLSRTDSIGNAVILRHELHGKLYYVRYCHPSKNIVSLHQRVSAGEQIGTYGDVGYSFGPHVHLDCYDAGWTKLNVAVEFYPERQEALSSMGSEQ